MIRAKLKSIVLVCALCVLTACKKEDPNPELKDPIFADLSKRAADAKKNYEEELKKLADMREKLEKTEPNSLERKNFERDILQSEKIALDLRQKQRFLEIRSQRRMFEGRVAYKAAFARGEQWPDSREYSDYLVNIRLREVPKNWNVRVPKLQDRLPSSVQKSEKGKEAEKSHGQ